MVITRTNNLCKSVCVCMLMYAYMGLPGTSAGKESACNAEDSRSVPGSGRSPGEGNGNPLQYFCLGNHTDRRAWKATVYGVAKSWTQLRD